MNSQPNIAGVVKSAMTAAEFLAWELAQAERHEFVGGEVFAMAGADDRHVTVAGNLYIALRQHLAGSPCRTYMADMRLAIASMGSYLYPDIMVTCSARDAASPLTKSEPTLVVEVLSPSTAEYDRNLKFKHYRSLPSLKEYALIELDSRSVDVYRLGADGLWVLHPFSSGQTVRLASVDMTITAEALFAEI